MKNNDQKLKDILEKFNCENSIINNVHCISDKSYRNDINEKEYEQRCILYIESVDKKILELYFRKIEIFHFPNFIIDNVILKKISVKYENGYYIFSNNSAINSENYINNEAIFIKSKQLEYKVIN